MKTISKLCSDDLGSVVFVRTMDNFSCQGQLKAVSDTSIELKDSKSKNTFTIFTFEIKEVEVLSESVGQQNAAPMLTKQTPVGSEKNQRSYYEHSVFGRLSRDARDVRFEDVGKVMGASWSVVTDDWLGNARQPGDGEAWQVKYLVVKGADEPGYKAAMATFEHEELLAVSFYHNAGSTVANSRSCVATSSTALSYLTLSSERLSLILDCDWRWSGGEFRARFPGVVKLLQSNGGDRPAPVLKLVHGGQYVVKALRHALQLEIDHFVDVQVLHCGLHNISVGAEPFRVGLSYSRMVELLCNASFAIRNRTFCSAEDVLHKMAFNAHFLVPMYKMMLARLLEPVRLLSRRLCSTEIGGLSSDIRSLAGLDKSDGDVESTIEEDLGGLWDDLIGSTGGTGVSYELVPRTLHFWQYRDSVPAIQARGQAHKEVQQQEGLSGVAGAAGADAVPLISKRVAEARQVANSAYHEVISDDEDDTQGEPIRENTTAVEEPVPNTGVSMSTGGDTDDWIRQNEDTLAAIRKSRVGDGSNSAVNQPNHGVVERVTQAAPPKSNVVAIDNATKQAPRRLGIGRGRICTNRSSPTPITCHVEDESVSVASSGDQQAQRDRPVLQIARGHGAGSSHGRGHRSPRGSSVSSRGSSRRGDTLRNELLTQRRPAPGQTGVEESPAGDSFCEMAVQRWHKNYYSQDAPATGKLGLLSCGNSVVTNGDDDNDRCAALPAAVPPTSASRRHEAMGILWSEIALDHARETDELYQEFGL